jgi:hypothetical protein
MKALAAKSRIVLVIFEACSLPDELAHYEWIDFRRAFDTAVDNLVAILKSNPQPVTTLAPQQGRILPPTPRLVTVLASLVAANAFPGLLISVGIFIWLVISRHPSDTLLDFLGALVIHLVPCWLAIRLARLPGEIRKRTHNFGEAQTALSVALVLNPLYSLLIVVYAAAIIIGLISIRNPDVSQAPLVMVTVGSVCLLLSVALIVITWWLLRSHEGMYRWAGPAAMRIFNRSQLTRKTDDAPVPFRPMNVTLEYDPVDEAVKDELEHHLIKRGHTVNAVNVITDGHNVPASADANGIKLALISRQNPSYETGEGNQLVIPVIIETADIPRSLSRLQWIDLRRGLPSRFAQKFADLLPDPIRLIRAVGVIPSKQVKVMPFQVSTAISSLRILLGFKAMWVTAVVIMWLTGSRLNAPGLFIAADLAILLLTWHCLRGLNFRSLTYRRYVAYAILIFVLSWTLQLFGQLLLPHADVYKQPDGSPPIAILSPAAFIGSIGTAIVQVLPLVILVLAVTPNSRRWLRKKPLLKVKSHEPVAATVSATQ